MPPEIFKESPVKPMIEEFIEINTYCCRYCHGAGKRLMTPGEYHEAEYQHRIKRAEKMACGKGDIGEFPPAAARYEPKKSPNPECPKCHGTGDTLAIIKDTRHLSPRGKEAYRGCNATTGGAIISFAENGVVRTFEVKNGRCTKVVAD